MNSPMLRFFVLVLLCISLLPSRPVSADVHTDELLGYVNAARANQGLPPLTMQSQLVAAAQRHNNDMIAHDMLNHIGSDGSTPGQRVSEAGYSWASVGENILYRFSQNAQGAFDQWWNSLPHRANMLSSSYVHIGITYGQHSSGKWYYTMVLAAGGISSPPQNNNPSPITNPSIPTSGLGDERLNSGAPGGPIAVFCLDEGGVSIWMIDALTSEGHLAISASLETIGNALAQAKSADQPVVIDQYGDILLVALTTDELRAEGNDLREPNKRYLFTFPASACGIPIVSSAPLTSTPSTTPVIVVVTIPQVQPQTGGVHIVQRGENLFRIALAYGLTTAELAAANGITNPNRIFVGQRLVIPTPQSIPTTTTTTETGLAPPFQINTSPIITTTSGLTHVVQPSENLFRIALRYGVSLAELAAVNGITNWSLIYVGQVLIIPQQ